MAKYVKRTCTLPIDVELITCERCNLEHPVIPTELNRTQTEGVQLIVPPTPPAWIQVGRNKLCPNCATSFNRWMQKAASDTTALDLKLKNIEQSAQQVFGLLSDIEMPVGPFMRFGSLKNELLNAIVEARSLIP